MNWEEIILKEKYQGPSKESAGNYGMFSVGLIFKQMNNQIEQLTRYSKKHEQELKAINGMIPYHIKNLQELIDEVDEKLIEQAKYGGNLQNYEPHQRKDFNPIIHGAKFREGEET